MGDFVTDKSDPNATWNNPYDPNWYPADVKKKWLDRDGNVYHESFDGRIWKMTMKDEWVINAEASHVPMWQQTQVEPASYPRRYQS